MKKSLSLLALILILAIPCSSLAKENKDRNPDAVIIAKVIYAEARGIDNQMDQAAVAWCILNRLDTGIWGNTVKKVVTSPYQFAWRRSAPVIDEYYEIACDVLLRWNLEKMGLEDVGRVLPKEYLYFTGRNGKNYFRDEYEGGTYWNWDCTNPYTGSQLDYEQQDMIGGNNQ